MTARTTLSDVAREAGVSLATASRAINGSADRSVRPELAERVLAAAARLNYAPDATAQAMARGRTTTLGLVVHDITDPYFSAIAAAVIQHAERAGLQVTLTTTQNVPAREAELVDLMRRQRARAVVVAGGRSGPDDDAHLAQSLAALRRSGAGAAVIGQPLPGVSSVAVDNRGGAAALTRALLDRGYRRFAVIGGPADRVTAADRRAGIADALEASDAVVLRSVECPFTWEGGHAAMTELLGAGTGAQVVLATNDVMALGALAAARELGVDVPGDVALAGFGGVATLRDVVPALSTLEIPMAELGERATELALASSEDPSEARTVLVGGTVALRDSTPEVAE